MDGDVEFSGLAASRLEGIFVVAGSGQGWHDGRSAVAHERDGDRWGSGCRRDGEEKAEGDDLGKHVCVSVVSNRKPVET